MRLNAIYRESRKLRGSVLKRETLPDDAVSRNINSWQVWFVNTQGLPAEHFNRLIQIDSELMNKVIVTLLSLGVRKHNRVPVIFSYEVNTTDAGSYKSSDDYLKLYRDPDQSLASLIGTVAHEIGHNIYNKLPEAEYQTIRANSRRINSFTRYTDPNFSGGEGHDTGNEWFADYVAAMVMEAYGLPADTKVGSWEPITDPKRGMAAVRKSLGAQSPGRNVNKSAATFRQKNLWMFEIVEKLLQQMQGEDVSVDSLNLPERIVDTLGYSSIEVLNEFLRVANNRLESLPNADRHLFLTTLQKSLQQSPMTV